jgi:hypothetical protein
VHFENSRFSIETRSRSYAIFLSFCIFTFVFSLNHKERNRQEEFAQELFVIVRGGIAGLRQRRCGSNHSRCRPEYFDLLDGFVLNGRDRRMTRNVYGRTNHHLSEMQK